MTAHRARKLVEAGVWLRISGDHEGARRLFEQALLLDPTNVRARQLLEAPASAPLPQQPIGRTPPEGTPAAGRNPFLRGESPSRSVGLDVDWGLAAILPESQSALRAPKQEDSLPESESAWDQGSTAPHVGALDVHPGSAPALDLVSTDPQPQPTLLPTDPLEARETEVQSLLQAAQDLIG